jgi:hypothetical protein
MPVPGNPFSSSRLRMLLLAFAVLCVGMASAHAETSATWITHPDAPANGRVTLHFRRDFTLQGRPDHALVQVSADNRFILFVNGQRVGAGPARGALVHWRYESFDIAPFLVAGPNRITATVWNWGQAGPMAQITTRTGFYLHAVSAAQSMLNSGADWRVRIDKGYSASSPLGRLIRMRWYYAAGPEEKIDAAQRDWSWDDAKTDEATWQAAVPALKAGEASPWHLVPDQLPQMRFEPADPGHVVQSDMPADGFPSQALVVPAHRSVHILLDRGSVEAAYPELTVSGGAGATVKLTYAEALYDAANAKGDRAQVTGRHIVGIEDKFLPDGAAARSFAPLWWRVWRFLEVAVETGDQPLTLEGLEVRDTGYPFVQKARFKSSDPELDRIWQIGWHTLQVDAHETFMDSAYWEQLQYIGDARVEAEIADMGSGDPRLTVQAIDAFIDSGAAQSITQSRYPTRSPQAIPTFSLVFVGIVHDFWMRNPDIAVVRRSLPLVRSTLDWFGGYAQPDGLLRKVPEWSFVDWIKDGDRSYPSYDANQESCVTSLLYLGALEEAADLEAAAGEAGRGTADRQSATALRRAIYEKCWDAGRGLIADHPGKTVFSQDANVLAVLYDVVRKADQASVLAKAWPVGTVALPDGLLPGSYYFGFYAARAYAHAGQSDRYLEFLAPWRALLKQNFTTWPELREPTRSDSHAWSGHPTAKLLEIVAGIAPDALGFSKVRIAPHLGSLTHLDAAMPAPQGLIEAHYEQDGPRLKAVIQLPPALTGAFLWKGKTVTLHPGANAIEVPQ